MEHIIKLSETSFEDVKSGKKMREYRLNDEKSKLVRVGDTIKFLKLPNLDEQFIVDVTNIEILKNWYDGYSKYDDIQYGNDENLPYSKKDFIENEFVIFTFKKHRITHENATVCYLKKDNQVLMIKFAKKWGQVYAPPGGKFESGETPLDCIMREYYEETGLTLINPRLQGISYWKDSSEGIIFIYTAENFEGNLSKVSEEGALEWIKFDDLYQIKQFDQNEKFTPYLFQKELFEGKFLLDDNCRVLKYKIRRM